MRLDTLLFQAGFGGRKQIKRWLRSQQVTVDGQVVTQANRIVDAHLQDIRLSGQRVLAEKEVYYLLHKPAGIVTACTDAKHKTVLDLLTKEDRKPGIYPIGRLDRDTEGLLLLTNNGPLGFRMLHPKHHVEKAYYVEVNDRLASDAPTFFEKGITFLDGTTCKPARLHILTAKTGHSTAHVTISEGKFHQIKKMFLAYGVKVTYLKRLSFGGFQLEDDLTVGSYRPFTQEEISLLKTYFDE